MYQLKNDLCEIIIAAWKLKSPGNMGQIIRTGHNINASHVLFVKSVHKNRMRSVKKTAGLSYEQMNWEIINEDIFFSKIPEDFQLVCIETCSGSVNLYEVELPSKVLFLFGNEISGLPEHILKKSDKLLHIPMPGGCKSLNVSNATAIAAFEWYRQMAKKL